MSLGLHNLEVNTGAKKRKKNRVGRGNGSGHGTYSTRGLKGQKARSGGSGSLKRLGMRMVLLRVPKYKGMKSFQPIKQIVNLKNLESLFSDGDKVTKKALFEKKLISSMRLPFKILGNGDLAKKLDVSGYEFSASAQKSIEKAGGKITLLNSKRDVKKQVKKKIKR